MSGRAADQFGKGGRRVAGRVRSVRDPALIYAELQLDRLGWTAGGGGGGTDPADLLRHMFERQVGHGGRAKRRGTEVAVHAHDVRVGRREAEHGAPATADQDRWVWVLHWFGLPVQCADW